MTSLILYINNNPSLFLSITFTLLCLLGLSILTGQPEEEAIAVAVNHDHHRDLSAIAGEDVISTQLDLAKAYIEMDQKTLAKPILDRVMRDGDDHQKAEARQLINSL